MYIRLILSAGSCCSLCRNMMLNDSKISCAHNIIIKNFHNGDIVNYSLLLIRGLVNPIGNCKCLIHLNQGNQTLTERICTVTGEFKFILDLNSNLTTKSEANSTPIELNFNYCNAETNIQITLGSQRGSYCLQPLYILCRDEEEDCSAKHHCKKIDVNLRLIQALYADRIEKAGLSRATFTLNGDCYIYRADISLTEAWAADGQTLWLNFAEEFLRKNRFEIAGEKKLKLIAFIGCTKYNGEAVVASGDLSYENIKKHLQAHAALGGGDLALFGSAFFYSWPQEIQEIVPCFLNQKAVNPAVEADESNYRKTYSGVYASTLGAVCHEIGHIFDLGHDNGIMGAGLDYVNRVITINNRTENLPKRIFDTAPIRISKSQSGSGRVTQFVKRNQNFLENYREQRKNDGFYFTRNCALILVHHKWFSNCQTLEISDKSNLTFNIKNGVVESRQEALKIIEIRSNNDSQVDCFYEIKDASTFAYKIPSDKIIQYKTTHYLFVMSSEGLSKRFDLVI